MHRRGGTFTWTDLICVHSADAIYLTFRISIKTFREISNYFYDVNVLWFICGCSKGQTTTCVIISKGKKYENVFLKSYSDERILHVEPHHDVFGI